MFAREWFDVTLLSSVCCVVSRHWKARSRNSQGDLWLSELMSRLSRNLPEDDAATIIELLSPEIRQQLRRYLETCPQTEDDWSKSWSRRIELWTRRFHRRLQGASQEQIDVENAREVRSLCQGAEILRDGISPLPPEEQILDPSLLAWSDGTIPKLALAIRDEEAFERMPILADALEDAGCVSEEILEHLRGPGPHHRSCWCLALILDQPTSQQPDVPTQDSNICD